MRAGGAAGGYLVHAYTASGVACGWFALVAALDGDARAALLWLALATFIDATDGVLAGRADDTPTAPSLDGARLDDIVDYVTYVVVPGVLVWRQGLLPPAAAPWVIAATLLASALGFARRDAKTADHLFTGFPSYWNIVAVYLIALRPAPAITAAILLALAVLVFVPIRYVYPSRTETLRGLTVALGAIWALLFLGLIWFIESPPAWLVGASLVFPLYYLALSLWVTARRAS
jgi:phosphatidylcholine synthase